MKEFSIIIGGDLVPTKSNANLFIESKGDILYGSELIKILNENDFRVFNLEVPLVDISTPISKHGPNLIAPLQSINGIKFLKPSLLCLANNHILDQGFSGLNSTIKVIEENYISHFGAGLNLKQSSRTFIIEKEGLKVGFYACTENEFSSATELSPGANPFNPLYSYDHVSDLKKACDYVIVLYHGGKEHYPYPSPNLRKTSKKFIENGASLIVCQHSHCIGAYEEYLNGTIVYGQGNFLFDGSDNTCWKNSLLINVIVSKERMKLKYVPINKSSNVVRLSEEEQSEETLKLFYERSRLILSEDFIIEKYNELANQKIEGYLRKIYSHNILLKVIAKLLGKRFINVFLSKDTLLAIENIIECESHRELFLTGLKHRRNR